MRKTGTMMVQVPSATVVWSCDWCAVTVELPDDRDRGIIGGASPDGWYRASPTPTWQVLGPYDFCSARCLGEWAAVRD